LQNLTSTPFRIEYKGIPNVILWKRATNSDKASSHAVERYHVIAPYFIQELSSLQRQLNCLKFPINMTPTLPIFKRI
jgi:hypothetical protein